MLLRALFLIGMFSYGAVCTQGAGIPGLPLSQSKAAVSLTNELRDVWPGIATATNAWAASVRQQPQWNEVTNATIPDALAIAEKENAVAALRVGYAYFVGDGVAQDYSL